MKSAYELAMERLDGETAYSADQKAAFAEIDSIYDARVAQAKLAHEGAVKQGLGTDQERQQASERLAVELRKLEDAREREKQKVRDGGT
mgnify:CR=1 FL=1